jgi:hypothetical protein
MCEKLRWFRMSYICNCGHEWEGEWSCTCDDECPVCGLHIQPQSYEEIKHPNEKEKSMFVAVLSCTLDDVIVGGYATEAEAVKRAEEAKQDPEIAFQYEDVQPCETFPICVCVLEVNGENVKLVLRENIDD